LQEKSKKVASKKTRFFCCFNQKKDNSHNNKNHKKEKEKKPKEAKESNLKPDSFYE